MMILFCSKQSFKEGDRVAFVPLGMPGLYMAILGIVGKKE